MFFSVLSYVTGVIVAQQFPVLPEKVWLLALLILLCCCAFFRYWRLMLFVIGLLWGVHFSSIRLADRLPEYLQGQLVQIEGKVVGLPQYDEKRVRFDFAPIKPIATLPEKIRLSWYFPQQKIATGQRWQFTVKLKPPHGLYNPAGFDYEQWLFIQNIGATGYVRSKPIPRLISIDPYWFSFSGFRQKIADTLRISVKQTEYLGIIKALTIGDRHDMSSQQWDVFRNTGTVHLLAISGLHIGLISALIYFLVLKIAIFFNVISPQKIASASAIIVAVCYSALAGFSLPTQRALLMLVIIMVAMNWQRNVRPVNTLILTLSMILIVDPLAVLSAGFWLSFLAVAMIVYSLAGRLGKAGYWETTLKIHWVTAVGLSPLLLYYFQQVSVIAPIANLITVPVVSLLIVPLCLIAVLLMFFSLPAAQVVLLSVEKLLDGLLLVLSSMAELSFSTISFSTAPFYAIVLALLAVFILLSPRGMPARYLGLVMLLPLFFTDVVRPKSGVVVMTVLDVGQGLSAVIETTNHVLVFDTGAKHSEQYDMGKSVVIPFLKAKAWSKIDTLLISHGDNDHIGGAEAILEVFMVDKTVSSVPYMLERFSPSLCESGQSWVWDQVKFEMLSPPIDVLAGENNNSCVLKVSAEQGSFLLTGDIEKEAEQWLVNNKAQQLASDFLLAPHHGSKTSSTKVFLKAVMPSSILIPSGYKNRFSFPHKEVLHRYHDISAKVFNTADHGALIVQLKNHHYEVSSYRAKQGKYWNN